MPPEPAPWWALLYDELLAELMFDGADPGEAAQTLALLRREGLLSLGARVFDQGCGNGRLALALLAEGAVVEGVDLIPAYIAAAQQRAEVAALASSARFWVGDIAEALPSAPCDLAMSWWTCLGYAPTDAENLRPLQRAFEALRPGGTYAIDTMNVAQVLRAFLPQVERRLARPEGELRLLRDSWIDLPAGVLHKRWRWSLPDGSARERLSAVRLYLPHEWARLLRRAGFDSLRFVGDLSGGPLTEDSSRCIIFAQRRT
ncbi:MAG: class I SAM-dependent methyltransferase [Deltaproteobacteria bacterium]|nr:class I SAM-dependent methyltransferase [Deltaproteobacteria bacterium]